MTGRQRTHPSRWEVLAWAGLEALAVTLIVAAGLVGVLAVAVLLP
jgi:hypothetical protein